MMPPLIPDPILTSTHQAAASCCLKPGKCLLRFVGYHLLFPLMQNTNLKGKSVAPGNGTGTIKFLDYKNFKS